MSLILVSGKLSVLQWRNQETTVTNRRKISSKEHCIITCCWWSEV